VRASSKTPWGRVFTHTGPAKNSPWRRRLTLLAMCIGQGMILLDVTIVNTALPSIQRELNASSGELEWVISGYALSLAALIPVSGSLGDRFGRKRFFAAGMVVFALGSVACALSPSALELIAARAVQGVGGAIMSALALSILTVTYSGKARAGAIGIWATVAGLGFGLGPVVGGLLLGVFGWSSIFWVNVPFAVAGMILTVTPVPESRNPDTRPVDVPGVLTSAAGLLALIFGLIESASSPWASAPVAIPLAVGVVLLASFVWWERRAPVPMIPPAVVRLRSFATSCAVYLISYASLTGVYFYLTLLYQDVDGWTALRAGLSWLFLNIPFLVMAQFTGRLSRRLPASAIAGWGLPGDGGRDPHPEHDHTVIAVHHHRDRLRALRHRNRDVDSRGRQRRHAGRPARPVWHRVGGIQRLPPGGHLDRPGGPRRHRRGGRNLRLDKSGRASDRRSPTGGDRASPQRRQRPHQLGDQGARDGSAGSRRAGLRSRLPGGGPHRRTWPHRRRDHRRLRAARQPQPQAERSRSRACITRRTRKPACRGPATAQFRHTI